MRQLLPNISSKSSSTPSWSVIFKRNYTCSSSSFPEASQRNSLSINDFTSSLTNKISRKNAYKTIILSPYSIYTALYIFLRGAKGNTAKELKTFMLMQQDSLREVEDDANFNQVKNLHHDINSTTDLKTCNMFCS